MLVDSDAVGVWFAAPDYVTMTRHNDALSRQVYARYEAVAEEICAAGILRGYEPDRWSWQGYYGWTMGGVSWGRSDQGLIMRASGWAAERLRTYELPYDNISRCDIALTLWLKKDDPGIARRAAQLSSQWRVGVAGQRWKVTHIDGYGGGDTCYLGSRSSDIYVRVYDKGRESKGEPEYENAWRVEVEYKGAPAKAVWAAEGIAVPTPDYWAEVVCRQVHARGLALPRMHSLDRLPAPLPSREKSTVERKLAWLTNQVAPAIEKLGASGVSRGTLLEALGLTEGEEGDTL